MVKTYAGTRKSRLRDNSSAKLSAEYKFDEIVGENKSRHNVDGVLITSSAARVSSTFFVQPPETVPSMDNKVQFLKKKWGTGFKWKSPRPANMKSKPYKRHCDDNYRIPSVRTRRITPAREQAQPNVFPVQTFENGEFQRILDYGEQSWMLQTDSNIDTGDSDTDLELLADTLLSTTDNSLEEASSIESFRDSSMGNDVSMPYSSPVQVPCVHLTVSKPETTTSHKVPPAIGFGQEVTPISHIAPGNIIMNSTLNDPVLARNISQYNQVVGVSPIEDLPGAPKKHVRKLPNKEKSCSSRTKLFYDRDSLLSEDLSMLNMDSTFHKRHSHDGRKVKFARVSNIPESPNGQFTPGGSVKVTRSILKRGQSSSTPNSDLVLVGKSNKTATRKAHAENISNISSVRQESMDESGLMIIDSRFVNTSEICAESMTITCDEDGGGDIHLHPRELTPVMEEGCKVTDNEIGSGDTRIDADVLRIERVRASSEITDDVITSPTVLDEIREVERSQMELVPEDYLATSPCQRLSGYVLMRIDPQPLTYDDIQKLPRDFIEMME